MQQWNAHGGFSSAAACPVNLRGDRATRSNSALFHPFPPAGNFGAAAPPDIHALRRYNLLP